VVNKWIHDKNTNFEVQKLVIDMLRVPSAIHPHEFELLKIQELTFVAYRSDVYPSKSEIFFEEHAVIYVLEGEKRFSSPTQEFLIRKGDVFFVRRGYFLMSESIHESYKSLVFFFDEKLIKEFVSQNIELFTFPHSKVDTSLNGEVFPTDEKFAKFVESIFPYFRSNTKYINQFLKLKLQELLLHLLETDQSDALKNLLFTIYTGQKTELTYLMNNYFLKPLSIDELAHISGRSLSTFKRDFQAEFGESPAHWIKQKRLQHAAFLLKNSSKNIAEISLEIGYESTSHFIKAFKTAFQVTPHQFQLLKNAQ
jgi:AraC-like DNA-binding protein